MQSNINKYYAFTFLRNFNVSIPIFYLFYESIGLSATQIGTLFSIFAVFGLILEVPSGIFADYFGRKFSIVIGSLAVAIGYGVVAASINYLMLIIAYMIISFGFALISGADTALLYDTLVHLKKENLFKKISGKAFTFRSIGFGLGGLVGGFIVFYGYRMNYIIWALIWIISFLISLSFKEPKVYKKIIGRKYLDHLLESLKFSWQHKRVKWLIIFNGVMMGTMYSYFAFLQPYMVDVGIDVKYFGVLYMVLLTASSLGAYYAHDVEEYIGEKRAFIMIALFGSVPLIFLGKYPLIMMMFMWFFLEWSHGFIGPIIDHYTNIHISSHHRATVMSISQMFFKVYWAGFIPMIGFAKDISNTPNALMYVGIFLFLLNLFILPKLFRS